MFDNLVIPKVADKMNIVSFRKMTDKAYDVTAKTTGSLERDDVATLYRTAVKGRAAMLPGSYRVVSKADGIVRFAAKVTALVKNFADCASMTSMGNNEFGDTAGAIWKVQKDGDDRFLVCTSKDDFEDLLNEHVSRFPVTASYMSRPVEVASGDFAAVVGDDARVIYGFVGVNAGRKVFLDVASQRVTPLEVNCVIDAVVPDKPFDVASASRMDMKEVWAYLSQIYPADFITKYKQAVGA